MSADPSGLFELGAAEILIVILLLAMIYMWKRLDGSISKLHDRISKLRDALGEHEKACAKREGQTDARLDGLETTVDRYTDSRFQALERAQGPEGRVNA